jgi:ATP-dependent protease Clp ATPase subunit
MYSGQYRKIFFFICGGAFDGIEKKIIEKAHRRLCPRILKLISERKDEFLN